VLRSTGNVADPQGAHEFEAWKPAQIVGAPFIELGILRALAGDRVAHDGVAEVINHCCDGERATEPFVETRFRHFLPPNGFLDASQWVHRWFIPWVGGQHAPSVHYAEPPDSDSSALRTGAFSCGRFVT
jgi:hypothetical protein